MSEPTQEQLAEWRRVTEAITRPWKLGIIADPARWQGKVRQVRAADDDLVCEVAYSEWPEHQANMAFMLVASEAMPALLDEVQRLQVLVAEYHGLLFDGYEKDKHGVLGQHVPLSYQELAVLMGLPNAEEAGTFVVKTCMQGKATAKAVRSRMRKEQDERVRKGQEEYERALERNAKKGETAQGDKNRSMFDR